MTTLTFDKQLLNIQNKLFYYAMKLTTNTIDAEDLTQETMLKVLTCKTQYTEKSNFKSWVYTIMKNTFINNYRRNKTKPYSVDSSEDAMQIACNQHFTCETPESVHSLNDLQECIDNMSDEYRIPFIMYTNGYKYKEISDTLNVPIGTVKSRIFLCRGKLKQMLEERNEMYV